MQLLLIEFWMEMIVNVVLDIVVTMEPFVENVILCAMIVRIKILIAFHVIRGITISLAIDVI